MLIDGVLVGDIVYDCDTVLVGAGALVVTVALVSTFTPNFVVKIFFSRF